MGILNTRSPAYKDEFVAKIAAAYSLDADPIILLMDMAIRANVPLVTLRLFIDAGDSTVRLWIDNRASPSARHRQLLRARETIRKGMMEGKLPYYGTCGEILNILHIVAGTKPEH